MPLTSAKIQAVACPKHSNFHLILQLQAQDFLIYTANTNSIVGFQGKVPQDFKTKNKITEGVGMMIQKWKHHV